MVMRMKHWAYVGLVFVVGHESLVGGLRAAMLTPMAPEFTVPGEGSFRHSLRGLWQKSTVRETAPVVVRLFADEKLNSLWIHSDTPVSISGRKFTGKFFITVRGSKIRVFKGAHSVVGANVIRVHSLEGHPFWVKSRTGASRWLRGSLRISLSNGRLMAVTRLDLEDYVTGVLEGELGSVRQNPELLKAQIVVARSYALSMRKGRHNGQGFEFCDQPHCQVFHGIAREEDHPKLAKRIEETRGEILTYHGRAIPAFYHHNCGGMTSAIEDVWPAPARPYLKAVVEPEQGVCRRDGRAAWRTRLSKKRLTQCFRQAGLLQRKNVIDQIRISQIDASGRAKTLELIGTTRQSVTVGRFRNLINQDYKNEVLKSALFTISSEGDSFMVKGRGWGHGVGFCQEGAKWLANQGKSYREILEHYYPHTTLQTI